MISVRSPEPSTRPARSRLTFGVGTASTTWLVSALYLATAIGQPSMGRLADVFGPRRIYLAGTVLVALGGVLG